jgi:hypothetical protein
MQLTLTTDFEMKKSTRPFPLFSLFSLLMFFLPYQLQGQCTTPVLHTSGTIQVGCTNVTVTAQGSTTTLNYCGETPYWAGNGSNNGSYTFTFSPPVSGVSLGLTGIDNNQFGSQAVEEVLFEINGAPYPITIPGTPGSCFTLAVITPPGAVRGAPGQTGAWGNMDINTTISTLKVEDVIISGTPNGVVFSLFICSQCCVTNAGLISASPLNLCPGSNATIPPASQTFLESNDLLQYILFTNPANTLGSIVATSTTPTFSFNPATMQTGVTYYIAAIAGNGVNGNVDLNDPCLNISNTVQVVWRPLPTVTFSAANPNVCAGACTTITATFTGTAPFTLTYTSPASGTVIQTFPGNIGTFQVCTLPGSSPGSLVVPATELTDAFCTCQ